ncbi:MAG TPA: alpha/beta fold hydrolase [Vicinamibacterales bacterium]|nr:alpha/beta fold hydrolase [Vicinamibacterales bacterium]
MAAVYRNFASACLAAALFAHPARAQELRRGGFVGVQVVAPEQGPGVRVQALVDGGSAKAAGVQANDVITRIGDHDVVDVADFVGLVRGLRAGDTRTLRIRRGGDAIEIAVPIRPRPYEQAPDADVLYGAVSVDGSLRRTIVTAPSAPGRHPAVLYVNGIGCYSQESIDRTSNDARLLYGLTRAGFVTMRVEKSGMGDSEGPACASPDADFRAEVRAYTAGLRALKASPKVDPSAVFVMGLSIGGVEAPLIAAQEAVRGLVVVNTVAKPFLEYLIDSRRRQMLLAHTAPDEIDRRMAVDERCNHRLLIEKQKPDAILAAMPECADHIEYPAPFTFMQQWADVNVAAAWKAIDRPVLIVYGESDFVSTIADDAYLAAMIDGFHAGRATLKAIPGMDHGLNKVASMAESLARTTPGEFDPAILDVVTGWLRAQA